MPQLAITDEVNSLAAALLRNAALPPVAFDDAIHVAICAVSGIDYLLSWNCKHIANALKYGAISRCCEASGFVAPMICTPDLLLAGEDGESDVE